MQKHPEGDLDRACGACAHVHDRERERKREAGGGGGVVSVKMISGFSVRMNFTTVSSHEII